MSRVDEIEEDFMPEGIVWRCPVCGDNGLIHGWEGSEWDRRELPAVPDEMRKPPSARPLDRGPFDADEGG